MAFIFPELSSLGLSRQRLRTFGQFSFFRFNATLKLFQIFLGSQTFGLNSPFPQHVTHTLVVLHMLVRDRLLALKISLLNIEVCADRRSERSDNRRSG